jgi:hypothetical protein
MLNIKETQSKNVVDIVGILKELQLEEKTSGDKEYIAGKAIVKVDQEINGQLKECEIPIDIYANKLTKDNAPSKLYPIVLGYKEKLVSLAACPEDQPQLASKIVVNGANISENVWTDQSTGQPKSSYKIHSNFLNVYNGNMSEFKQKATFELTGVLLGTRPETINDQETGRLKIKFAVVGYNGRVDIIDLIAESPNAVNFISSNYQDGDTVQLTGRINISRSTKTWEEEQGFGEPIIRTKTETRREFIVTGGSPSGLDEAHSYDANDIKAGLDERALRIQESKNKAPANRTQTLKTKYDW